ncbi:hypothetical protein BT63DRAFT_455737 [Microthyrium microscopicum]|uniref:NAD(P)-binding protein n=1 Tax=Microthyrium microscopicum TaxID=703497 RepID=A0A6A6UDX3_9PEZI|nr:hypothetical protein BT63DRAFT_455737 [Microthyrium microscopicum]
MSSDQETLKLGSRLEGKFVIINVGANNRVGQIIGQAFASEGAIVSVPDEIDVTSSEVKLRPSFDRIDRDPEGEERPMELESNRDDTSVSESDGILEKMSGFDILVNITGVLDFFTGNLPYTEPVLRKWANLVNDTLPTLMSETFIERCVARGSATGLIINVWYTGSSNRLLTARPDYIYYSNRVAIRNLTCRIARDDDNSGIRCNLIMPGGLSLGSKKSWVTEEETELTVIPATTGEDSNLTTPEGIATLAVFLAMNDETANGCLFDV